MSKIVPTEHEYNVALSSNANSFCPQNMFTKQIGRLSVCVYILKCVDWMNWTFITKTHRINVCLFDERAMLL
jgi:hypothetical protein